MSVIGLLVTQRRQWTAEEQSAVQASLQSFILRRVLPGMLTLHAYFFLNKVATSVDLLNFTASS